MRELAALAALGALSSGYGVGMPLGNYHPRPDPNVIRFISEKPLTKRARRRQRGKSKGPRHD